jgi:dihydropteroate synthase
MGILNVTPDSFSDGGAFFGRRKALEHALKMARDGADIIDVGGESTRPGSREVDADEELDRVIPVIRDITRRIPTPVSIDTRKSEVAGEAIRAGARIVNDVSGLMHDPAMAYVIAGYGAAAVLMHMRGSPADMQKRVSYRDVAADVIRELRVSIKAALSAGIREDALIVDPGIGFAKDASQSLELISRLEEFKKLKLPVCIGVSRKSFISKTLGGAGAGDRLSGTIAACALAIMNGANIVRVHDVSQAKSAAVIADSIMRARKR